MLLRTFVGAVAGAVAGAGFLLTLDLLARYCNGRPSSRACTDAVPMLIAPNFAFWMVVAGVLIALGFRARRAQRGWWATGIGSGLWVVLIVAVIYFEAVYLDLLQEEGSQFRMAAGVIVPCVTYAFAALCIGRRSA